MRFGVVLSILSWLEILSPIIVVGLEIVGGNDGSGNLEITTGNSSERKNGSGLLGEIGGGGAGGAGNLNGSENSEISELFAWELPGTRESLFYFRRPHFSEYESESPVGGTYKFVVKPPVTLTAQDPLAVLENPPEDLLGEPHVIRDYPQHQAIHMPVIPALNFDNLQTGLYLYQRPAVANCIDKNCECPRAYNPICAFDSRREGFPSPDRGYRVFSNSCSFKCAQKCDQQIQFAYCGECDPKNEAQHKTMECLKEVFDPPTTPEPVYNEPIFLRRSSFLHPFQDYEPT